MKIVSVKFKYPLTIGLVLEIRCLIVCTFYRLNNRGTNSSTITVLGMSEYSTKFSILKTRYFLQRQ